MIYEKYKYIAKLQKEIIEMEEKIREEIIKELVEIGFDESEIDIYFPGEYLDVLRIIIPETTFSNLVKIKESLGDFIPEHNHNNNHITLKFKVPAYLRKLEGVEICMNI